MPTPKIIKKSLIESSNPDRGGAATRTLSSGSAPKKKFRQCVIIYKPVGSRQSKPFAYARVSKRKHRIGSRSVCSSLKNDDNKSFTNSNE